jgi:GTPase SAR1 family protein
MKSMHEFKICVAGASFVGKTQIINRIINNAFHQEYVPTHELDEYSLIYSLKNNHNSEAAEFQDKLK